MRNLLRNSEILSSFTIYTVLSLITIVGAYLYDRKLALPALFVCTVFTVIHMNCIYIRYKRISKLSADIDRILHGEEC